MSSTLAVLALTLPHARALEGLNALIQLESTRLDRPRVSVTTSATAAAATAEIRSDAGKETVDLVESDARLHGGATIAALPKTDARITLTVYDADSLPIVSFSGELGADARLGWSGWTTTVHENDVVDQKGAPDLGVLGAEVYPGEKGAYDLTFDLNGADAHDVAYAQIVVTETTWVTTCSKEKGCTTTGKESVTKAEIGWDAVEAVWDGELGLVHGGPVEVDVRATDGDGKKIGSTRASLGVPWLDEGYGQSTLTTEDDPLTRLALLGRRHYGCNQHVHAMAPVALVVQSDGWTLGDTLPAEASVELEGGQTLRIPVNSVQETTGGTFVPGSGDHVAWDIQPIGSAQLGKDKGHESIATDNRDGSWSISTTVWSERAEDLPTDIELLLTPIDKEGKLQPERAEKLALSFSGEVSVVFALEVDPSGDPVGADLSGQVTLLGEADDKGRQETLSKGAFHGSLTSDGDGDLALAGADKGDVAPRGDILIGGEPIGFELTDDNKDGVLDAPPVILRHEGSDGWLGSVGEAALSTLR